jgi:hypothetical protein
MGWIGDCEGVRMRAAREPRSLRRASLVGLLVTILSIAGLAGPASAELVGSVSGTVRASGVPVANAWVTLMPVTPTGDWAGRPVRTTTDRDGHYEFSDLYAYHVKIQVRAPSFSVLASAYWPGAYSFATAGTLRVASSGSTADVDLPVAASISGRVVDAATGDAIIGARVLAHVDAPPGWEPVGSSGLAPGPGQFVVDGLPPVPVALQVHAREGSNHLGQWYDGAGFYGDAEPVQPGTTGIVIRLREGGEVSGVVRNDRGAAVPGAAVTIVGCPALCPMAANAGESGTYRVNGVPPGPGLRAYADAAAAGLLNAWYVAPGQVGDTSFDLAPGQVRADVDFALTAGAVAIGQILDGQTGEPLRGASVDLVDVENPLNAYVSRGVEDPDDASAAVATPAPVADPGATFSAAGSAPALPPPVRSAEFVIGPVPPGQYSLIVYPGTGNGAYVPVELVSSTGLDGAGLIDLARGERARFTLSLARQRMPVGSGPGPTGAEVAGAGAGEPASGQPEQAGSSGWPGLFGGFLVPGAVGFLQLGP